MNARPCLLEPIHELEIKVPDDCFGKIVGDLSGRRGKILGMDNAGRLQVVKALVPAAELHHYGTVVRSLTGGRGLHGEKFSHYEEMPAEFERKVVEERHRSRLRRPAAGRRLRAGGLEVLGVDLDARKVAAIAAGRSYVEDVPAELLQARAPAAPRDAATTRGLDDADAVLICVPTPLTRNREPDLGRCSTARSALARACCSAASWSCSSRRPTPAPRASRSRRCSRRRACAPASTSTSPSRPSASTPAAPTSRSPTPPRSSAA